MAIVVSQGGGSLVPRAGAKVAKKAAKHAAKKHAAKKHAEKHAARHAAKQAAKKAAKHTADHHVQHPSPPEFGGDEAMARAFHHLQRASAVISLLEQGSGGDLRRLLEDGIGLYRRSAQNPDRGARAAFGLLRAVEHLGMAGLYSARGEYRIEVEPPPRLAVARHLREISPRLDRLPEPDREIARRLESMARELLRRVERASHDPHLEYELIMAAEGICTALEEGV